jgi:hypothetical protein
VEIIGSGRTDLSGVEPHVFLLIRANSRALLQFIEVLSSVRETLGIYVPGDRMSSKLKALFSLYRTFLIELQSVKRLRYS